VSAFENPDALNELGRELEGRGEIAMAIALQRHALRIAPMHPRAVDDEARIVATIASPADAEAHYAMALALEPDIEVHHRAVGSLRPFVGMDHVEQVLRAAVAANPAHARAQAALANLAARRGDRAGAMQGYALATMLDWDDADAHLALAQLYDTADQYHDAARHFRAALSRKQHYTSHLPSASRRILVLKTAGTYLANALFDFAIDPYRTNVDVLFLIESVTTLPGLGDVDAVVNAIGATEAHRTTIDRAITILGAIGTLAINPPSVLHRVHRDALPATLRAVPGCSTPPVRRVPRDRVAAVLEQADPELPFPLLIRPVDAHRGDGLVRLDAASDLPAYLTAWEDDAFTLTPFVDYRSDDGYYRKYRVIVVGGEPLPYHLAISPEWLAHYWRVSDLMREHAWMRAEEERFLEDPASVFPTWRETFGAIAAATGLDYFGVDCALDAAGRVLVFECDPSAFVHCHDDVDEPFAYKYRYVPRIFAALDDLIGSARMR
jgi:glutathione synthase/RimK-type ligase-like ATP-grasp enzyme